MAITIQHCDIIVIISYYFILYLYNRACAGQFKAIE